MRQYLSTCALWFTAVLLFTISNDTRAQATASASPRQAIRPAHDSTVSLSTTLTGAGYTAIPLIPLSFTGLFGVSVRIKSTSELYLFDSGASGMVNLDKAFADSLGITGSPYIPVVGVGGQGAMVDSTQLSGIVLGSLLLDTQAVTLVPNFREHVRSAGAIGAALLGRYHAIVDYTKSTLYMNEPKIATLPISSITETQGIDSVTLMYTSAVSPRPIAMYLIHATINGKPVVLLLDTAADATALDRSVADALHIPMREDESMTIGGSSGAAAAQDGIVKRFEIGSTVLDSISIVTVDLTSLKKREVELGLSSFDGILGNDVLVKLGAVVDFGHSKVYLHRPN